MTILIGEAMPAPLLCLLRHRWSMWTQEECIYTRTVLGSPCAVDQKTVTNVRRCLRCGLEKRKVAWAI